MTARKPTATKKAAATKKKEVTAIRPDDKYETAWRSTPIFCETLADMADTWPHDQHRPYVLAQLWTCGGGDN